MQRGQERKASEMTREMSRKCKDMQEPAKGREPSARRGLVHFWKVLGFARMFLCQNKIPHQNGCGIGWWKVTPSLR